MQTKGAILRFKEGLHLKKAGDFSQLANKYISDIQVIANSHQVNGKSLLGILSLGTTEGTTITVIAEGIDEKEAVLALTQMVEKKN